MIHFGKHQFRKDSGKLEHIHGRTKRAVKRLRTMKYENSLRIAVVDMEKVRMVDLWQSSSTAPLPRR